MSIKFFFRVLRPAEDQMASVAYKNVHDELLPLHEADLGGWPTVWASTRLATQSIPYHSPGKANLGACVRAKIIVNQEHPLRDKYRIAELFQLPEYSAIGYENQKHKARILRRPGLPGSHSWLSSELLESTFQRQEWRLEISVAHRRH